MTGMRAALLAVLLVAACNGAPAEREMESGPPTSVPADAASASADGAGAAGPHLDPLHPGWKSAHCFDCHEEPNLRTTHMGTVPAAPSCVDCHGYNGAPHVDHAADPNGQCAECHSTGAVVSDHLTVYLLPRDCATCHVHPSNRGGL